jgi:hypothetical protein
MAQLDQESDWILKSQKGDHHAFETLITHYQQMIHALTYRMSAPLGPILPSKSLNRADKTRP